VLTTWLGIDVIPDDHRLFVGRPGSIAPRGANFALQNCDLLLIVGARMDMSLTAYAHDRLARAARKVMVDIDSAEISKMRTTIDVPIHADAGDFLREVRRQAQPQAPRSAWLAQCAAWKVQYPVVTAHHRQPRGPVSAYHFSEVLSDQLLSTDIVAPGSSGFASEIFLLVFRAKAGQRVFHNRGTGAMGFGLPGSIGACLGSGRKRTVCVDGDGGFQMNIQELATIAALNLPIKFFVLNNQGYASIRASQQAYFGRLVGADNSSGLQLPDLGEVTRAYGLTAFKIEDSSQLEDGIRASLESPGPSVCEIVAIPDEARGPRVASKQRPDGSMVSSPLEDLWPFLERDEFLKNMIIAPLAE
jgi:acetolactate synthase-1/2/3 large subunit